MKKRNLTLSAAISLSVLITGCASTAAQNPKIDEARAAYDLIKNDPAVARSGNSQLRAARTQLTNAETLLEKGADSEKIEQAAYLANRHAQIAAEQGERATLQKQIETAEQRRRELMLAQQKSAADQARMEAEELRKRMAELQAEQTDRGMVLTLGDVLFDLNKSDLKPAGEQTVSRLAQFMREYENRRVRIEGYTDSTGSDSYNQALSERRAESVRDALADQGVSPRRIETRGYGKQYPVAGNQSPSGRQQNRRVEIVISDKDGNISTRED